MRRLSSSLFFAAVLLPLPALATTFNFYTGSSLPLTVTGPGYSATPALNTPTDPAWTASIPGATWVSASGQDNYSSANPNGSYVYSVEVDVAVPVTFTGEFSSDNNSSVYITPLSTGVADLLGSNDYGTSSANYSFTNVTGLGPLFLSVGFYTFDFDLTNGQPNPALPDGPNTDGPTGVLAAFHFATSPTPEPSSLMLLGTGILGLAGVARRRLGK